MRIARSWRQQPSNLRLDGALCRTCGAIVFPRRARCPSCGGGDLEGHRLGGKGEVCAATTVYEAPAGFADQVPYVAALVRLEEGPVIAAMLTDVAPDEVAPGTPVEMVTRRIRAHGSDGPIEYGYKFSPAPEARRDR